MRPELALLCWSAAVSLGCGGRAAAELEPALPPGPRCHTGFELGEDERGAPVCRIKGIHFEGGTFTMGRGYCYPPEEHAAEYADGRCELGDQPHERTIGPFYMDAVEFPEAADLKWPGESTGCSSLLLDCGWPVGAWGPVARQSTEESLEVCQAFGKTLPTEAQWEYAASAGGTRTYPWGDRTPTCADANFDEPSCGEAFREIGEYPPSPEGLYDLAGHEAELVLREPDWYTDGYPDTPVYDPALCKGPEGPYNHCQSPMVRGGQSRSQAHQLRAAHRATADANYIQLLSFRCVRIP